MRKQAEESIQLKFCKYIKTVYPKVIFTADASGLRLPIGLAMKCARMRSTDKIPDMLILQSNSEFNGLFIEQKKSREELYCKDGSIRKTEHIQEQSKTLEKLRNQGYAAVFSTSLKMSVEIIDRYMRI